MWCKKNQRKYKWESNLCPWIGRLNSVKVSMLSMESDLQIQCNLYHFPMIISAEIEKNTLKFIHNLKKCWIVKIDLEEQSWRPHTSWFQTVIKILRYWHKDRYIVQWKRIEHKDKPSRKWQMIFNKCTKTIQWGRTVSLTN